MSTNSRREPSTQSHELSPRSEQAVEITPLCHAHDDTPPAPASGSYWYNTSALMVGEVMGTGILSLPYAAAGLGWVLSGAALILFGFFSTYAGVLLSRVKMDFHPKAGSYADLAHATMGPTFGKFTRACVCTSWFLLLPYYLIATADALQLLYPSWARHGTRRQHHNVNCASPDPAVCAYNTP